MEHDTHDTQAMESQNNFVMQRNRDLAMNKSSINSKSSKTVVESKYCYKNSFQTSLLQAFIGNSAVQIEQTEYIKLQDFKFK